MANCDSNFTQESTGGASGTVAGLRTYKWCYVDTAVKDCAVNCGWHEFELDVKGNKVAGTEKYIDKDGNEFTLPLASTIQERECPIVPAEPPPVPPEELTFIGKNCDDEDVPVTGLEGQIVQVVQATDTVFKVKLCNDPKDIEHWILCDKVSGDKVAVIVDYSTIPPVTSYWDIITNSAWTGDPKADLEQCAGTDLESDKITMCDNGTTFYRWIVKSNGEPTGDFFDTDLSGLPYEVTGTVSEGKCEARCADIIIRDCSGLAIGYGYSPLVAPIVGATVEMTDCSGSEVYGFIMATSDADHTVPIILDGVTVGFASAVGCEKPMVDVETHVMCDNGTEFLRNFVYQDGVFLSKSDLNADGTTYTVSDEANVTFGKCELPPVDCLPTISSATADDLSSLLEGDTVSVQKNDCCSIKVTTSAGDFILAKNVTGYSTSKFNCPVTVESVEILSGTCSLSDIIITTQFSG